jgi:hypothetical protein
MTVTVDKRAAVHDAVSLNVTLSNAGSMRTDELNLDGRDFPLTFTLSAPGRSGALGISVDAVDGMGTLVGRGVADTNLTEMTANVMLDSADFVVNSEFANDQFLTSDYEAVGFQLAGISNGQWAASFRDECTTCDIYGRRYEASGLPAFSQLAAGDIQFSISTTKTTTGAMPALASAANTTLAFWDYTETGGTGVRGVGCRAFNEMGSSPANQLSIAADAADVVSATGILVNGTPSFAVTWQVFMSPTYVVRGAIVTPNCTVVAPGVQTLSASMPSTGMFGASRPNVASNMGTVLYTWITDDDLWVRTSTAQGTLGQETLLIPDNPAQTIEHVRVTPWGSGFAIAVRWISRTSDGPGKIELYRTNIMGQLQGNPILITDASRSDFSSNKGFSIAQRTSDNALMVVWHVCEAGAGLCDVFGRILRASGAPVGEPFMIPTSTASEQINPSVIALQNSPEGSFVAAWNDSSGEAPDRAGTAVRARVFTPLFDDARGVHGATCGASAPGSPECGEGLACASGSDTIQRCYYICQPPSCPTGGTCSTVDETTSACTF